METQEKSRAKQIVRAQANALAVRSAALVSRGLRDLARDSNWLIKKVFAGRSLQLVVSPAGELCALSALVRHGAERIALYDIERGVPTLALVVPGEPDMCPPGLPAAFAWSPTARHLATYTISEMYVIAFGEVDTRTIRWPDPHVEGFIPLSKKDLQ